MIIAQAHKADGRSEVIEYDTTPRLAGNVVAPLRIPEPVKEEPNIIRRVSSGANCVATLRNAGFHVPRTKNGYAATIPVDTTEIAEGEVKVAVTTEGPLGHVLAVKKVDGKLVSVAEGAHPVGVGRIVSPSVLKGFID